MVSEVSLYTGTASVPAQAGARTSGGSPLKRYWLFQLPALALVAAAAWPAARWLGLPDWAGWVAIAAWLAKDAIMYPFLRAAFVGGAPTGQESMIGAQGTVRETDSLTSMVKVGPEYWRATSAEPVAVGQRVRVVACTGMTLRVEADETGIARQRQGPSIASEPTGSGATAPPTVA